MSALIHSAAQRMESWRAGRARPSWWTASRARAKPAPEGKSCARAAACPARISLALRLNWLSHDATGWPSDIERNNWPPNQIHKPKLDKSKNSLMPNWCRIVIDSTALVWLARLTWLAAHSRPGKPSESNAIESPRSSR